MIRRIAPCAKDATTLGARAAVASAHAPVDDGSLRGRVVVKPWGHEFLIFDRPEIAAWLLRINPGHSTSMHCHPGKRTSLLVLQGQALCNTFESRNYLGPGEAVVLEPRVFHSTKALSPGGLVLIEVESPRNKGDLVRLSDVYGRESFGYEGLSETKTDGLDRYGYFFLREDEDGVHEDPRRGLRIGLVTVRDKADLQRVAASRHCRLLVPVDGDLSDDTGDVVAGVAEAVTAASLGHGCPIAPARPMRVLYVGLDEAPDTQAETTIR